MEAEDLPLSGIRVLDLGRVFNAPHCTALMAMMGAEVIKVESEGHLDSTRLLPPFYEDQSGVNRSLCFNMLNVNKQSVLLDLSQPKGKDLFKELVRVSDVVVDNFSPLVMKKLGLGYDSLRAIRPDIIMASHSGFGATGPEKDYLSYATTIEALAGLTALNGFPGGPPLASGIFYPDFFLAHYGALAILAALLNRRDLTGEGQFIDVSQLETMVTFLPEGLLDEELNGRLASPSGNTWGGSAPSGVYRCKGEDKWVAIHITTDAEWKTLCAVLREPARADDERFATALGRATHWDELSAWVQDRVGQFSPMELMHDLQQQGISAGASFSILDLIDDPHLAARGLLCEVVHPVTKAGISVQNPWHLSATPGRISSAAPLLGEHTVSLLHELLGMTKEEVNRLAELKVLS